MYICTATTVHLPREEINPISPENFLFNRLSHLFEEILKPPTPVLEHPGSTGNFTDRNTEPLRYFSLRPPFCKFLNQLPALGDGIEFLGRQNVLEKHLCFLRAPH